MTTHNRRSEEAPAKPACCEHGSLIEWQPEYGTHCDEHGNPQRADGWALHATVDGGFLDVTWDDLKFCPWCGVKLPEAEAVLLALLAENN